MTKEHKGRRKNLIVLEGMTLNDLTQSGVILKCPKCHTEEIQQTYKKWRCLNPKCNSNFRIPEVIREQKKNLKRIGEYT